MPAYKQISLKVSKETYEKIKARHADCPYSISLNKFIVRCAAEYEPVIVLYNYDAIIEHNKEIGRIRKCIWPVVAMLTATGQSTQEDIETIVSYLEKISEAQHKLLDDTFEERERLDKLIKKELKSIQKRKKDGAN